MPAATARLAPSRDALRSLRRLAYGTQAADICDARRQSSYKRQHTLAQQKSGPGVESDGASVSGKEHGYVRLVASDLKHSTWRPLDAQKEHGTSPGDSGTFMRTRSPSDWAAEVILQDRQGRDREMQETLRMMRTLDVVPPADGVLAYRFWHVLASRVEMHDEVVGFALELHQRRLFKHRHMLWWKVIAASLKGGNANAVELHSRMRSAGMTTRGGLVQLANHMLLDRSSLFAFRQIYLASDDRDIYDSLIQRLTRYRLYDDAVTWHNFLLEQGDRPSETMANHPFVREMSYGTSLQPKVVPMQLSVGSPGGVGKHSGAVTRHAVVTATLERHMTSRLTREIMSRILGDVHGVRPIDISDHLCARFFATTAFPVDFVITGLAALGVSEIGPLALRQLALRCDTSKELLDKLTRIKSAGLYMQQGIFISAVSRLAVEGRDVLLKDMLASDQHPDVFANKTTQSQLLQKYMESGDMRSAHWTLYILIHYHGETHNTSWNRLVRYHAERSEWDVFSAIMDDVLASDIWLSPTTVGFIMKHRLRQRRQGHSPVMSSDAPDDLRYLISLLRTLATRGWVPPAKAWTEVLRRLGMTDRWDELTNQLIWLVQHYSSDNTAQSVDAHDDLFGATQSRRARRWQTRRAIERGYSPSDPQHPLQQLVPPAMQRAIVHWGFKVGFKALEDHFRRQLHHDAKKRGLDTYSFRDTEQFQRLSLRVARALPRPEVFPLRGLLLLRQLQGEGVHIDVAVVRRAVEERLWLLYGPHDDSKLKVNRRARMINPWTVEEMLMGLSRTTGRSYTQRQVERAAPPAATAAATAPLRMPSDLIAVDNTRFEAVSTASDGSAEQLHVCTSSTDRTAVLSGSSLQQTLGSATAAALDDIVIAMHARSKGTVHRPLLAASKDAAGPPDLSQRAELQRRVRLAVSVFGLGRYTSGRTRQPGSARVRMTLPMYVELVRSWAHKRLKRKLGLSGALARPRKRYSYELGGKLKRSLQRRGLLEEARRRNESSTSS